MHVYAHQIYILQELKTKEYGPLAGLLAWLEEHHSTHQKVGGLIPSQGTYLGCGFNLWSGSVRGAVNLCFSLSLPLSLKSNLKTKHILG